MHHSLLKKIMWQDCKRFLRTCVNALIMAFVVSFAISCNLRAIILVLLVAVSVNRTSA